MQRLKYEGREKDAAIANANGAFHDDPVGFAMKQYLFYMCFKCNLPYFAGGYQERRTMSTAGPLPPRLLPLAAAAPASSSAKLGWLPMLTLYLPCLSCLSPLLPFSALQCQEANQAFDPSELVCPGCQPHSVEDCALHGRDWLAYKCRYCCSFATWTCWSNTHCQSRGRGRCAGGWRSGWMEWAGAAVVESRCLIRFVLVFLCVSSTLPIHRLSVCDKVGLEQHIHICIRMRATCAAD